MKWFWLFICCLSLCNCDRQDRSSIKSILFAGNEMTINYRITIGQALSESEKNQAQETINAVFNNINTVFNKWNLDSEISRLNSLPGGITVQLSPQLYDFLCQVDNVVRMTGGLFDPTVEPMQQLWRQKLEQGLSPTSEEVAALQPTLGWDKIHFESGFFYKNHDNIRLDLSGIVKGHCVDMLVESLQKLGIENLLVDWGGEFRASGHHPSGRPWALFISRFGNVDPAHAIDTFNIIDGAVATSGDYLQSWIVEDSGKKITYTHILHPKLCRPLVVTEKSISSATIMAPSCMLADGIATAVMLFPTVQQGEEWLKELQGRLPIQAYWLKAKGGY